jgi:hypothetical protein
MTEIHLIASDQKLSVSEKPIVATGAKNSVKTVFEFDSELWNVCGKQAIFWNEKTPQDIINVPLDVYNSCVVPASVLTKEGYFYIGVIGLANDGETKKTSTLVKYQLKEGTPDGTGEVVEPPADIWEQCLAIMGETLNAAQASITTASDALNVANSATDTANEAVEKLNVTYVDADGYIHIFVLENIKGVLPTVRTITDENGAYIYIENVDGSVDNTKIIDLAELKGAMLDAVDEEIVGGKMDKPVVVESTGAVTMEVAENTEYVFSEVTGLTMTGNTNKAHGFVTFGASTPSISVTGFVKSGGDDIASAKASEVWEFSCDNGYIIWKNWSA